MEKRNIKNIRKIDDQEALRLAVQQKMGGLDLAQLKLKEQVSEMIEQQKKKEVTPKPIQQKQKVVKDNTPRRKGF